MEKKTQEKDIRIRRQIRIIKDLGKENRAIYRDLKQTRKEKEMSEEQMEEIETEFFNILGNIKLLFSNGNVSGLGQYINEQYEVIKKDLFSSDQTEK